jgi:polyhydroxyalkanoate synthase
MKRAEPAGTPVTPASDAPSAADIFADLNAAWLDDGAAFSAYCSGLSEAIYHAGEKVCDHFNTETVTQSSDAADQILEGVRKLAWTTRQYHQVLSDWMKQYVEKAPQLNGKHRKQALFWVRQFIEMSSPNNCFWTNPQAVSQLIKSDGHSLLRGMINWMADLQNDAGLVALADRAGFKLGRDLAATPGRVVFRNSLVEVIQYAPQTDTVWQTPIVLIQPWINKYYIFDLGTRNSLVGYLARQGYTVFITSWKNPGPELRQTEIDDYIIDGAKAAVEVAGDICRTHRVHAAGYCIGGTALAAMAGWMARRRSANPVCDISLFATLLDFSDPGDLAAVINPEAVQAIRQMASAQGVLQAYQVASAFRLLNPADLIWRYVVNNYFCGEPPPRSDMLFWNSDGTRLPEAMCNGFLEAFYQDNRMAQPDALKVRGRAIDLRRVKQPLYIVGAAKDHICPWPSTFQSCGLAGGKVRYVLADEGHITGIVNPPSPWSKKQYLAGAATRLRDNDKWKAKQVPQKGSWWPDWLAWLKPRSGPKVAPPGLGSKTYPAREPAPGTYVFEK